MTIETSENHEKNTAAAAGDIGLPDIRARRQKRTPVRGQHQPQPAVQAEHPVKVAVVGMAGKFPGADSLDEFWQNLVSEKSSITRFPYWHLPGLAGQRALEKAFPGYGGFIGDATAFDADFFQLSAREVECMDPQHRLVLEQTWAAFENAGISPGTLRGSDTGVFIGVSSADYHSLLARAGIGGHTATGNAHSVIANRISYLLDFHGPSEPVDTACSSSLVAVHKAVRAIVCGDSAVAVAGGVNLCLDPGNFIGAFKAGMLSRDGLCKTFAADADGYVRGEGVGIVILKHYATAEKDGDNIIAAIIGSAQNHGGKANSLTAPNARAQADLIKTACKGIAVDTLGYIETHGTGTPLGDPVEIAGLKLAFSELQGEGQPAPCDLPPCYLGSVKTNIGHLESAAGIAGMIKVLLMLKHGVLPKSLHCETLNPYIDLKGSRFEILQQSREWLPMHNKHSQPLPLRAGISSFGFGGANAHLVLEQHILVPGSNQMADEPLAIVLSAKCSESLQRVAMNLRDFLRTGTGQPAFGLRDLAYTLQVGREPMPFRLGIIAHSVAELPGKLEFFLSGAEQSSDIFQNRGARSRKTLPAPELENGIKNCDWAALLRHWVEGGSVDWTRCYRGVLPRRLSLPTYPFARNRYWIPEPEHSPPYNGQVRSAGALHPLLHRNISNFRRQRFESVFSPQDFFLDQHRVNNRRTLPGVACLEMVRAAMRHSVPERTYRDARVEINGVVWLTPFVLHEAPAEGAAQKIYINLFEEAEGWIQYEICTGGGEAEKEWVLCRGRVRLDPAKPEAQEPQTGFDNFRDRFGKGTLGREQCYALFSRLGLDYGPAFQGIEAIHQGDGEALAELELPAAAASPEAMVLHPGILDSALQATLGLMTLDPLDNPRPMLPFAIDSVEILGALSGKMRAWVRFSPAESQAAAHCRVHKFDLDVYHASGAPCVRIRGFSARVLELNADSRREAGALPDGGAGAANLNDVLYVAPVWLPGPTASQRHPVRVSRHCVAVCTVREWAGRSFEFMSTDLLIPQLETEVTCLRSGATDAGKVFQETATQTFELVQSMLSGRVEGKQLLQVLVPNAATDSTLLALYGLLLSARRENPNFVGQVIEVAPTWSNSRLREVIEENAGRFEDTCIRYDETDTEASSRRVRKWQPLENRNAAEADTVAAAPPWRDNGVYLITGGAGGLGLLVAEAIAARVAHSKLILAGRSPLSDSLERKVKVLSQSGAVAEYRQVDVCDYPQVESLIESVAQAFGKINGIFHCAGVVHDNYLVKKTSAEFERVLAPKVLGLCNIDRASAGQPLDFMLLFSSIASVFGNPGQADYAAANAFMDCYAACRNGLTAAGKRSGRTLSINWPLWRAGGMHLQEAMLQQVQHVTGMRAMATATGIAVLARSAELRQTQYAVMEGDPARMRAFVDTAQTDPERAQEEKEPPLRAGPPASTSALEQKAIEYFKHLLSAAIKRPAHNIDMDEALERYGVDSIILTELVHKLEHTFGALSKTLFFEYQTIREVSEFFCRAHADTMRRVLDLPAAEAAGEQLAPAPESGLAATPGPGKPLEPFNTGPIRGGAATDIAIVSLEGRYPQAADTQAFWEALVGARDCVTEIPATRWDHSPYYDPDKSRLGKAYGKWGGFIEGVDLFDAEFFHISPREAELIDPKERLFLETAWNLLERAGYTSASIQEDYQNRVGVYVGAMYQQYHAFRSNPIKEALVSLSSYSSIANRVSYFFNFQGPSIALDTMCSSALTAIHMACEGLHKGDCKLAIAGAVNLNIHPKKFIGLSLGQIIGSHSNSRSFADGDGYLPAEAVGAVLLKPLRRAIGDGDRILAVIKSTATNHGGRTHGFTVPSLHAQAQLIEDNFTKSGIDPRTISYVEAAANGSALGDPIEIGALGKAFGKFTRDKQFCAIGSVKSNIGHAEAASGMSQLTKVVLQMQHRQLVPSIKAVPLNPKLDFENTPFYLQNELQEWVRPVIDIDGQMCEIPRRATLSAFGAGGSNAHLIIEEFIPPHEEAGQNVESGPQIIPLSALNPDRLLAVARNLLGFVEQNPEVPLANLAYTLQSGREAMVCRAAFVVETRAQLVEVLKRFPTLPPAEHSQDAAVPIYRGNADEAPLELKTLLAGKAGEALLQVFIAENHLDKLALYWTQGGRVPWRQLRREGTGKILDLPTYPFARQRYWLETYPEVVQEALHPAVPSSLAAQPVREGNMAKGTVKDTVMGIVANLLGVKIEHLNPKKPLDRYGFDSILLARLSQQLQASVDSSFNLARLAEARTLGDILSILPVEWPAAKSIKASVQPGAIDLSRYPELVRLNQCTDGVPVFWFHGALGGSEVYGQLAQRCPRPFYGIQARGWLTDRSPLTGIQAMAAYYVHILQLVQPEGPYDLGGYSLGGMLAYEVARQLQELGHRVATIVMLDSPDVTGSAAVVLPHKSRLLQAVNMALLFMHRHRPEKFSETLIHRDEVDLRLSDEAYLKRLIKLAKARGLAKTEAQLRRTVGLMAKVQESYRVQDYSIQALPDAKAVTCYYFRNRSGAWMGAMEPYFTTAPEAFAALESRDYWRAWERNIPAFHLLDVDSSSHMTLLAEPEVAEVIYQFCEGLYSGSSEREACVELVQESLIGVC